MRHFAKKVSSSEKVDTVELESQKLQQDLADKIKTKTDSYEKNLNRYMRTLNFHA